jgi:hypothetical protein
MVSDLSNEEFIISCGFGRMEHKFLKGLCLDNDLPEPLNIYKEQSEKKVSQLLFATDEFTGNVTRERLILFHNVSNDKIYDFIQNFKQSGLPSTMYAMVTEHNIHWPLNDLIDHLVAERDNIAKKEKS